MAPHQSLSALEVDSFVHVLVHLRAVDVFACTCVCKKWREWEADGEFQLAYFNMHSVELAYTTGRPVPEPTFSMSRKVRKKNWKQKLRDPVKKYRSETSPLWVTDAELARRQRKAEKKHRQQQQWSEVNEEPSKNEMRAYYKENRMRLKGKNSARRDGYRERELVRGEFDMV
eukprot:TRINITY_DN865_c0_g1_i1.p1 TRINITY_DN865_c0_g1~~TRINITY_DN865_c0_g1_i1.p1  ORF type:complete len:195 (+),score=32.43 TRINITY_DN865_c0_g1_i1:72-587(+)